MKLLALLPTLSLAQNVNFNNFCAGKANWSKHADIFRPGCETYLRCFRSDRPRRLNCAKGTVYNEASQRCDFEMNVPACAPSPTPFCVGKDKNSYHANPSDDTCESYYRCTTKYEPVEEKCRFDLVFNAATGKCDYQLNVPQCAPSPAPFCVGKDRNSIHANADDDTCKTYLKCQNEYEPKKARCPGRWLFNPNINRCDRNYRCKSQQQKPQTTTTLPPTTTIPVFEFSTEFSAMNQIITTFLNENESSALFTHGCHCARLNDDPDFDRDVGGEAIDELDMLCKDWLTARNCLRKNGGACPEDTFFSVAVNGNESQCLNGNVQDCDGAACAIDRTYVTQIFAAMENKRFDKKMPVCASSYDSVPKDSCCGVWPNSAAYSSQQQVCKNGQVFDKDNQL